MCKREGCYEPAIGVGNREPVHGRREPDECRPHYLESVADQLVRAEVTGDVLITDVRTNASVGKGGIVELDPVATSIEQLVYNRFIKVLPKTEAKPVKKV